MKTMAWIPVALIVGMALGAWPAKNELRQAREEIEKLRREAKSKSPGAGTLGQLTQIMRIPDEGAVGRDGAGKAGPSGSARSNSVAISVGVSSTGGPRASVDVRAGPRDERTMRERIEAGMEAWRVRSDIARNNFIANAGLDAEKSARFDVLTQAMNLRLKDRLAKFAEEVKSGKPITPESGARVIHDLSGAVVITYDEMDRSLPEWRSENVGRFDMADFIDPSVAEPLIDIEGDIRRAEREQGRRR